jgi:transposase-like protein
MPNCQACSSSRTVKNGHIHTGKQRFKCHDCGGQIGSNLDKKISSHAKLITRLIELKPL